MYPNMLRQDRNTELGSWLKLRDHNAKRGSLRGLAALITSEDENFPCHEIMRYHEMRHSQAALMGLCPKELPAVRTYYRKKVRWVGL